MTFEYDTSKIARVQAERGLTDTALALAAGVHPSTVKNVLTGRSGTPTTIRKLAFALDLKLSDLVVEASPGARRSEVTS